MSIGTQASSALVLSPRRTSQTQTKTLRREAERETERCVWRVAVTILKQRWDFYRFSRSLPSLVLLQFYVKSAELLHYPHPMPRTQERDKSRAGARRVVTVCCWLHVRAGQHIKIMHCGTLRTCVPRRLPVPRTNEPHEAT